MFFGKIDKLEAYPMMHGAVNRRFSMKFGETLKGLYFA